jgi:hypothetical protein
MKLYKLASLVGLNILNFSVKARSLIYQFSLEIRARNSCLKLTLQLDGQCLWRWSLKLLKILLGRSMWLFCIPTLITLCLSFVQDSVFLATLLCSYNYIAGIMYMHGIINSELCCIFWINGSLLHYYSLRTHIFFPRTVHSATRQGPITMAHSSCSQLKSLEKLDYF